MNLILILCLAIANIGFSAITIISEQYHCWGGISGDKIEFSDEGDPVAVPVNERYDVWGKEGRTVTGGENLYAWNRAERLFVEADVEAFSEYSSGMADAAAEGIWTFRADLEGLKLTFDYRSYDTYYPAIPHAVLTDLTTPAPTDVFSLDSRYEEYFRHPFPVPLYLSHIYTLSMKVEAGTFDAGSGGKLSMNIVPEPATLSLFVFGTIAVMAKRK